jgi:Icc-related predicted phosphoesterase
MNSIYHERQGRLVGQTKCFSKKKPKLSLHGHIHESPELTGIRNAKLGRMICIQPGQVDEFTYVTIDMSTMKLERVKERYIA